MSTSLNQRANRQELLLALGAALSGHFGQSLRIKTLRRRRSVYSSSCAIENLEVELPRGRRLSLVLKDLSPACLLTAAQEVRPQFLYNPVREIETYRSVLDPELFGTAAFYGASERSDLQRYWLFLERVRGPLLWQVGDMETWRQAARWMARLHTRFSDVLGSGDQARLAHLLIYDRQHFGIWLTRAEAFMRNRQLTSSQNIWRQFSRLASSYDRLIDRLIALPRTLIHGEFYPSNIIVAGSLPKSRICPIDWELAAFAPGLIDLAALAGGDWTPDQRRDLVAAYRDALEPANGWPPPMPDLLELVDCCQLHLSMQWLGWAANWTPPKMHAQDWLGSVFRLAERLGL